LKIKSHFSQSGVSLEICLSMLAPARRIRITNLVKSIQFCATKNARFASILSSKSIGLNGISGNLRNFSSNSKHNDDIIDPTNSDNLKTGPAEMNDWIEFTYVNTLDNGMEIDEIPSDEPMIVQLGHDHYGDILEGMPDAFVGKLPGETFELKLTPEQRGESFDKDKIRKCKFDAQTFQMLNLSEGREFYLPSSLFERDGEVLEVTEQMFDDSHPVVAFVMKIQETDDKIEVTFDLNSPYANENFNYEIKLLRNFGDKAPSVKDYYGQDMFEENELAKFWENPEMFEHYEDHEDDKDFVDYYDGDESTLKTGPAVNGDFVKVHFVCTLEDGTEIEVRGEEDPVFDCIGHLDLPQGMNEALIGKLPGESFELVLTPEDRDEEYLEEELFTLSLPQNIVERYELQSKIGQYIDLPGILFDRAQGEHFEITPEDQKDEELMYPLPCKVISVSPAKNPKYDGDMRVRLDFNLEHCDKDFHYKVTLVSNYGKKVPFEYFGENEDDMVELPELDGESQLPDPSDPK
jgi:FKBP-type peptidyl-prolyl cis-trans isomerase 2